MKASHGLKAATRFKKHPPKGLWHQHHLEGGLIRLAKNIERGLNKFGMPYVDQKIAEAEAAGEERYSTADDIANIAHDVVSSNWERLR